jgi:uncharacterized protein with von Willebrand factor type A (vWA) domain
MVLTPFFYLLRARGLDATPSEWLTLLRALYLGLCRNSLIDFYYLARSVLSKSEADYDNYDLAFSEFFGSLKGFGSQKDIPDEFFKWLEEEIAVFDIRKLFGKEFEQYGLDELMKMLEERIAEQKERHDGGSYWVGTGGTSPFGHGGYHPGGIRVGGVSRSHSAIKVAEERRFRDFRGDNILDTRQFQMAFRRLRQFSSRLDTNETELNIDETIKKTGDNGGRLELVYQKPRKNSIKLLMLFDSGGSMNMYAQLCSELFQSAQKSDHFKDLQIYYFHNCPYERLYTDPHCRTGFDIETSWALKNLSGEYKVLFVGDANMAPSELLSEGGSISYYHYNERPGLAWLRDLKKKFKSSVWLNPIPQRYWSYSFTTTTIDIVRGVFPMFELTLDGIDAAIERLLKKSDGL